MNRRAFLGLLGLGVASPAIAKFGSLGSGGLSHPEVIPPLHGFSNVHGAYGVRRLTSSYRGPLIGIREDGADADQDFYAKSNGDLDQTEITNFLDGNSGFVHTLYDQSGNGRDFTQTTDANQPALALNSENGHPTIDFTSASSHYLIRTTSSDEIYASPNHAINIVLNGPDGQAVARRFYTEAHTTSNQQYQLLNGVADVSALFIQLVDSANNADVNVELANTDIFDGSMHSLTVTKDSATDFVARVDGAQTDASAQSASGTFTMQRALIGAEMEAGVIANHITMDLCEFILFTAITEDFATLEANQIVYWGI